MTKRNLTLSELTGPDLNISLGLIDDITQKLKQNGHINAADVDGLEQAIEEFIVATPTTTHVSVRQGVNTILAANSSRKLGTEVFNDTNRACYFKLGASATPVDFYRMLPAQGTFTMTEVLYQGVITAYYPGVPMGEATVTEYV